jgi:hypothetical protein
MLIIAVFIVFIHFTVFASGNGVVMIENEISAKKSLVFVKNYRDTRVILSSSNIYIANDYLIKEELELFGKEPSIIRRDSNNSGYLFHLTNNSLSLTNLILECKKNSGICGVSNGYFLLLI